MPGRSQVDASLPHLSAFVDMDVLETGRRRDNKRAIA
jgi:hypothetical protein